MAAPLVEVGRELAQGVADLLNAQEFSQAFEATRAWSPVNEVADADDPLVSVVPDAKTLSRASRGTTQNDIAIDVVIQRRHGDSNPSEIGPVERCDEIADLAQEFEDFLFLPTTAGISRVVTTTNLTATPMSCETEKDTERLVSDGIFAVRVSLIYRLWR